MTKNSRHEDLADSVPESWIAVLESRAARDDVFPHTQGSSDLALARELFTPLDGAVRDRIIERALDERLAADEGVPLEARAVKRALRRGVWRSGVALAALAAVVMLMWSRPTETLAEVIEGEVTASSAMRGSGAGPAVVLRVAAGDAFYLRCAARDDGVEVESVRASRTVMGDRFEVQRLGFRVIAATRTGADVHVQADLPRGQWEVTCGVVLSGTQRFVRIGPPARVEIE